MTDSNGNDAGVSNGNVNKGSVKWFDRRKGFGFIIGPAGEDVFVHFTNIESDGFRCLRHGERVEYEIVQSERGLHAAQVKSLEQGRVGRAQMESNGPAVAAGGA